MTLSAKLKMDKDEIISEYDPNREDRHELPPNLWKQFDEGFYPLPRKDK